MLEKVQQHELELRVLELIEAAAQGRPTEDALVELKSAWPSDLHKMARRLAGHANAAGGSPILWLIGVDEKTGATLGAERKDAAEWYPQLEKQFDGEAPRLFDMAVHSNDKTVVALSFETSRAPYVVKTSAAKAGETHITHEVPWREGTRVRTARREDLLRILVPAARTPKCEVLSAIMIEPKPQTNTCRLMVELFLTPTSHQPVCIPFRDITMVASWGPMTRQFQEWRRLEYHQIFEQTIWDPEKASLTIRIGAREAIVNGPGTVFLSGDTVVTPDHRVHLQRTPMVLDFALPVVGAPQISVTTTMKPATKHRDFPTTLAVWSAT